MRIPKPIIILLLLAIFAAVTLAVNQVVNQTVSITVTAPPMTVDMSQCPASGVAGQPYTCTIGLAGGLQPYSCSASATAPPPTGWIVNISGINRSQCLATGTPATVGPITFGVVIKDSTP